MRLFALALILMLPACAWMGRREMSCPGRAGSGADHKYYCEIGEIIEKSFRKTIAEAVAENTSREAEFQGMHAEAEMRLDQEGNLKGIWLPTRSENPRFNRAALEALRRVSPLPKPPEELFRDGTTVKLFWDFRLTE